MQEYIINITEMEELQTIKNTDALDHIFARAKKTLVGGERVVLVRQEASGRNYEVEALTTLDDLDAYRQRIFKYL